MLRQAKGTPSPERREGYTLVPIDPTKAMIDEIAIDNRFASEPIMIARYRAMLKAGGVK